MTDLLNILFSPNVLKFILFAMSFTAAFMLVYYLFPDEEALAAQKRLGMEEERVRPKKIALLRWFYPIYSNINALIPQYAPEKVLRWIEKKIPYYQQRLIVGNVRDEITPDDFIAFKVRLCRQCAGVLHSAHGVSVDHGAWFFLARYLAHGENSNPQKRNSQIPPIHPGSSHPIGRGGHGFYRGHPTTHTANDQQPHGG